MVALSLAENLEPGGELASTRELPDNYRPALAEDVPEGRACGNCFFFDESRVNAEGDKAWCERWDDFVDGGFYCNAWESDDDDDDDLDDDMDQMRAINQEAPAYMRAAARRGLEYYEEGLAGDGVTPKTIREAREMAEGRVSDDKWIRIAAWIARHLVDLDSPDANPDSDNYPSAGVVDHLLWGSGPSKRAAQRTKDYADSVVARIRQEETNSMDNKDKWLKVARAIALKIDGVEPEAKQPEVRTNSVDFEVRAEGDGMTFTGYASVFNSPSEDLGGFVEYVAPGAFKRSLQSRNEVKLLWNHDSGEPLASLRGGTMQLVEDEVGLKVTAKLPNTTRGRDIAELLRTKVIDSMSFGFNVIKDSWSRDGQTRTLESVRLFETSIVSFPAYPSTTATVRSQPTINPDQLADALLKLESGEELDEANASLITDVVAKLKAQPEVQEAEDNGLSLLDLKQKQFDLLMKRI
jgi:HK97 family phage prohead protease